MWEVAVAHIGTEQFESLTRAGWEPFGVTAVGNPSRSHNLYHFRRQLPSPTLMKSGHSLTKDGLHRVNIPTFTHGVSIVATGDTEAEARKRAQDYDVSISTPIVEARIKSRIDTLKEVGMWLYEHHNLVPCPLPMDCCLILNKLRDATLKGEMP